MCAVVYILLIVHYYVPELRGDEIRYINYADNLLHGFFSPQAPDFNLWSGPGFPLVLAPFIFLGFSHFQLVLLNVVFLVLTLVITNRTLRLLVHTREAMIILLFLGLYFPISKHIYFVHTECFTWLILASICNLLTQRVIKKIPSVKRDVLLVFLIAYLAMVKVVFGYVILSMLAVLIGWFLVKRQNAKLRPIAILSTAFLLCMPWLFYTYAITGRVMFWTNCSTLSLYTMSTSYAGEYGDWQHPNILVLHPEHRDFVGKTMVLSPLEQYDAYKDKAIENIKLDKMGYAKNWLYNIFRMLFEYPTNSRANVGLSWLKSALPLLILLPIILLCIYVHIKNRRCVAGEISVALLAILVYLGGSSLVSAMERMFFITLPFWMMYVAYFFRFISLDIIKIKELIKSKRAARE